MFYHASHAIERLSGLDASFLYLETSQQHLHVSIVAVLDPSEMPGGYAFDKVTPLDRSRPLWEAWIIEGLADGHFACVTKVHHCAVDGASGAELMVHLFSVERTPPAPPTPERIPTDGEMVQHALASRLRMPLAMVQLARKTVSAVADVVRRRRDP